VKRLRDLKTKRPVYDRGWGKRFLIALCLSWLAICHGCRSTTAPIRNGDLTRGTDSPENWQSNPGLPGLSILRWHHTPSGPGELEIHNVKPNDSHWTQIVHLDPGWYLFTAEVRAEAVPADHAGANLSSLEDGIISTPISGTTDWKTLGFYLKVGNAGADLPIACRLGGYSSPNTGTARFRNIMGKKVEAPTQENIPRYDLDTIRGIGVPPPKVVSTPLPTRAPIAKASPIQFPTSRVAPENMAHASRDDILLERSIDVVDLTMTLVLVLATLYAGGRVVRNQLFGRRWQNSSRDSNNDLPNSTPGGAATSEDSTKKEDQGTTT
jgi:hypothetical protein